MKFGDGCSASFVSPRGLILTNHHCVRGDIANNQGEHDWVDEGFVASRLEDETRLHGLTVQQLVSTVDATAQINEGIGPDDDDEAVRRKRQANEEALLASTQRDQPD